MYIKNEFSRIILNWRKFFSSVLIILTTALGLAACGTPTPATIHTQEVTPRSAVEDSEDQAARGDIDDPFSGSEPEELTGVMDSGHFYIGNPAAPIVIEEFSDFQCPFCSRFSLQTLPTLSENQIANGEVLIIYHDFPLENIHPQAFAAANAARCAGEQGSDEYWQMHDLLYQRTQLWSISNPNPVFSELADEIGLDLETFNPCVEEIRYSDQIQADIELGISRGVRSTPSFFINGQSLIGAQPIDVFNQAITSVSNGESIAAENAPSPQEASPLQPPPVEPTPAVIASDDFAYRMGDPDAPVTIVEFTDYQCPFCQRHALETYPMILDTMIADGTIQYIFKDLPLDSIHPNARTAALAARCAGEQDAFLEMHDAIFSGQEDWAGAGSELIDIFAAMASELSLDETSFRVCIEEDRFGDAIQSNVDEALSIGADSTPYFFIDGYPIAGAQSYDLFTYAVNLAQEGILAEAYVPPEPDLSTAYTLGDPNAPVVIIEYTDYQCPYCARHFEQTFKRIREEYVDSGQVYYIFKDFPLMNIHPQALKAAEAARCAGDQGSYVEMHDRLFSTQGDWGDNSEPIDLFVNYAKDLNLDAEEFASCLQNNVHEATVLDDLREGSQRGINGTPSFVINGYTMSGAQPYEIFKQAIEQFLAES